MTEKSDVYYNEFEPFAADWLRNLAAAGQIPEGEIDGRDVKTVEARTLQGRRQVHLFAGIGGWSEALRIADWRNADGVWTVSCPCQPFSVAGRRKGVDDERHLWPVVCRLVAECRPPIIFGEQVASKSGKAWLHGVRADLEALGYSFGAADLCAAGVGAPHIRQRLYWVAHTDGGQREQRESSKRPVPVFDADGARGGGLRDPERLGRSGEPRRGPGGQLANGRTAYDSWWKAEIRRWADGSARRIEPGIDPLAHGVPGRVGRIRGWGNAIVPQVAAEFILAAREAILEQTSDK